MRQTGTNWTQKQVLFVALPMIDPAFVMQHLRKTWWHGGKRKISGPRRRDIQCGILSIFYPVKYGVHRRTAQRITPSLSSQLCRHYWYSKHLSWCNYLGEVIAFFTEIP